LRAGAPRVAGPTFADRLLAESSDHATPQGIFVVVAKEASLSLARRLAPCLFALTATALDSPVSAQVVRIAGEFQVNVYTNNRQWQAAVASDADGDFVVVWESTTAQDGEAYGLFGRRYTSLGAAIGAEFQVSVFTLDNQSSPSIVTEPDGDFVVAWRSRNQDGGGDGIFARRFTSSGGSIASEFQVNVATVHVQNTPALTLDPDGGFVIVWQSYGQDNHRFGVFSRRFSSDGAAIGTEFQVNLYTTLEQFRPAIAIEPDGDFMVAWQSNGQDGSFAGVFGRLFSSTGTAVGGEFQINSFTAGYQEWPAVVMSASDFVVAWSSAAQDGSQYGVFARRFSISGGALASEFQVNTYTSTSQRYAAVSADADGDFVLVWHSNAQDGNSYGIFGRRFSSAGGPLAVEFRVNTYTTSYQRQPAVAVEANGDFVVAWSSGSQDGGAEGIFAQRYGQFSLLDIDANGAITPLTDGLLLLRSLFGFTGAALTTAGVGGGCARCDATAIKTYTDGLGLLVDVDGNGATAPLTDGLLVLRRLFGFSGVALTTSAVGGDCTRCSSAAIEGYLAWLGV
jgi:hypothetical protein